MLHYQVLASTICAKIEKSHRKTINLKCQFQHKMKNGPYSSKKHQKVADNSAIKIYLNKIEKRVTFKIKARYHVELLTPKTMKLLGNTKNKIIKMKTVKMFLI